LADTKFEFGLIDNTLHIVDEIFTPDSSRFWDAETYEAGRAQDSWDKQFVRDYLESLDWNKTPPGPELPPEIVARTRSKYLERGRNHPSAVVLNAVLQILARVSKTTTPAQVLGRALWFKPALMPSARPT
jgi:phosphoribosylaminoimidazole-succinocarboxamide synthase